MVGVLAFEGTLIFAQINLFTPSQYMCKIKYSKHSNRFSTKFGIVIHWVLTSPIGATASHKLIFLNWFVGCTQFIWMPRATRNIWKMKNMTKQLYAQRSKITFIILLIINWSKLDSTFERYQIDFWWMNKIIIIIATIW